MSLTISIGPMYAGKTNKLISDFSTMNSDSSPIIIDYNISEHEVDLSLTHVTLGDLVSHDNQMVHGVFKTNQLKNMDISRNYMLMCDEIHDDSYKRFTLATDIYVNECQFFPDLKQTVIRWLRHNVNVHLYGLDGDYMQHTFGQTFELIPFANRVHKLNGICYVCNKLNSIISYRDNSHKNGENKQIIFDDNNYVPLCLNCYFEKTGMK